MAFKELKFGYGSALAYGLFAITMLLTLGGCEPQLTAHAAANIRLGNDKAFLIKVVSQCLPYIGYPRCLNALRWVNEAAAQSK